MSQRPTPDRGTPPQPTPIAARLERHLAPHVGAHTARNAVKTFARRALDRGPEELTAEDLPALLDALRPMLQTLLGQEAARQVLAALLLEVPR